MKETMPLSRRHKMKDGKGFWCLGSVSREEGEWVATEKSTAPRPFCCSTAVEIRNCSAPMVLPEAYAGGKSDPTASPQSAMRVKSSSEARQIGCFVPHRKKAVQLEMRAAPRKSKCGIRALRSKVNASFESKSKKVNSERLGSR
ncbi:MAG: hypothetical protein E7049_10905 [Lentisphaerae bacterium]|nr:hypothetical protein [Lentisphaerota bacterium]